MRWTPKLGLTKIRYGAPEVIHTDRGRQFVGRRFSTLFREAGNKLSTGDRGFKDNIVIQQ